MQRAHECSHQSQAISSTIRALPIGRNGLIARLDLLVVPLRHTAFFKLLANWEVNIARKLNTQQQTLLEEQEQAQQRQQPSISTMPEVFHIVGFCLHIPAWLLWLYLFWLAVPLITKTDQTRKTTLPKMPGWLSPATSCL